MTVRQRWQFRRNLVIAVAHREGFSQRVLAEVFDLPRSRIQSILREVEQLVDDRSQPKPTRRGLPSIASATFRKGPSRAR